MASLDIVIVNWNAGEQLLDCLQSIQTLQTEPVFYVSKCIVVDNASTDRSADALDKRGIHIELVKNLENVGFGTACNQGAAAGEGDYILFLNPDVKLFPDSLTKAISFLEGSDSRGIGLMGVQLVDENCQTQPSTARFPTPGAFLYQMAGLDRILPGLFAPFIILNSDQQENREVDVVQGAFLVARRIVFDQLGGFDKRFFMYYEDVDLAYRARNAGSASYYYADARAYHRGGGTTENIKATRLSYWMISRERYVRKHFGHCSAAGIVIASFTLELGARLVWNLMTLSWRHLLDTVGAYRKYAHALQQ